jgi:hypothetical protein
LSGRFRIHKMDTFVERRSELRLTGLHPYSSKSCGGPPRGRTERAVKAAARRKPLKNSD